jgi:hypothetical protein
MIQNAIQFHTEHRERTPMVGTSLILHIPHASRIIPPDVRAQTPSVGRGCASGLGGFAVAGGVASGGFSEADLYKNTLRYDPVSSERATVLIARESLTFF